ncbi:MAG: hypothetical protein HY898_27330 [Deltaproteobacteria bacterium]|nr:hypothetical protein [Deltaproteobacteria bacterium]
MIATGDAPTEHMIALFRELPPERAGELTGLDYFLLEAFPSECGMLRVIAEMASDVEWQWPKGQWAKLVTKLAAKFPAVALPALLAAKPKLARYPDSLDKAIEAAEKALAKGPAKEPPKKAATKPAEKAARKPAKKATKKSP